ncbi:MAG TPA: AIR synthase related protein, partial [Chloroflexota bacterium]|nr:AIR synthase related protein [Chloroflexota bacterium]
MSTLRELGEQGAIEAIRTLLAEQQAPAPLLDVGDDAAAWQPTPGRLALQTTDLLIEGVHFSLEWFSWYDVGWKAMAVNISDIAAMGGVPRAAFVSAGLRPETPTEAWLDLYRGLIDCAASYGVRLMGGDTVTSPTAA